MTNDFFKVSAEIRAAIHKRARYFIDQIPHSKLKDIICQRNNTSSFLKGAISYFIHEGVGGQLSEKDKIELATGIEILCSSGTIFDNAIDGHVIRNDKTTFLEEYGVWMQIAASQYALHHGLKLLFPFMHTYTQYFSHMYSVDEAVLGMVGMDIERSKNLQEQIRTTERSNGRFAEIPIVIASTTGTCNNTVIENVSKYGFNLGTALGIYEEVRDMLGKHGRRSTEIEKGRFTIALHMANESSGFDANKYVGRTIKDEVYVEMIRGIIKSDAMRRTQNLAERYFNQSEIALRLAVDKDCFDKLISLRISVSSEFDNIISEAESKYG